MGRSRALAMQEQLARCAHQLLAKPHRTGLHTSCCWSGTHGSVRVTQEQNNAPIFTSHIQACVTACRALFHRGVHSLTASRPGETDAEAKQHRKGAHRKPWGCLVMCCCRSIRGAKASSTRWICATRAAQSGRQMASQSDKRAPEWVRTASSAIRPSGTLPPITMCIAFCRGSQEEE